MKKIFCDRCKKEIFVPGRIPNLKVQENDDLRYLPIEFVPKYTYDLCSECQLELKNWLTGKETSNGTDER